MKTDKLIRSLSIFGCFICLYFVFNAFYTFDECIECNIVHTNFKVPPLYLGTLGIAVFLYYFFMTKFEHLKKAVHVVSSFVLVSEVILLNVQKTFKAFCMPCVGVGVLFILTLCVVYHKKLKILSLSAALSVFASVLLSLVEFSHLNVSSPFLASEIAQHVETPRYLVIQSSCKHCERLLEDLNAKSLLNTLNVLSLDKPTQIFKDSKTVKDKIYEQADWSNYSNQGLYNFLNTLNVTGTPILIEVPNMNNIQLYYGNDEIIKALEK